uniref:Uncharacterized protein n=1 Tax=Cacopsylla melanoneura TaxID=428564 RepID=A0A8D8TH07_9HEMI
MQVVHKSSMACLFVALLLLMSVNPFNSHRWYQDCQWSIKKEIGTVQQPSNQMNRIQEISHEESGHQINRMRRDNKTVYKAQFQARWTPEKRREHSQFMKDYWKRLKEGSSQGFKKMLRSMRAGWEFQPVIKRENFIQKKKDYWRRLKSGSTEKLREICQKLREKAIDNWTKLDNVSRLEHSEKIKDYWRNLLKTDPLKYAEQYKKLIEGGRKGGRGGIGSKKGKKKATTSK